LGAQSKVEGSGEASGCRTCAAGRLFVRRVRVTLIIVILKTSSRSMLQPHMKPKSPVRTFARTDCERWIVITLGEIAARRYFYESECSDNQRLR